MFKKWLNERFYVLDSTILKYANSDDYPNLSNKADKNDEDSKQPEK